MGEQLVSLVETAGKFYPYNRENIVQVKNATNVMNRLKDIDGIYVPALPCFDLILNTETIEGLLPVYMKGSGKVSALNSGKRSAIIQVNGRSVRLKGCGNMYKGFNIEAMEYPVDGKEIRGCCFSHTVVREQYMSDLVGDVVGKEGFKCGNSPIGIWEYEDAGVIKKYCGLFYTLGEKRLATHLLSGIDLVLNGLAEFIDNEQLLLQFPEGRVSENTVNPTINYIRNTGPANRTLQE